MSEDKPAYPQTLEAICKEFYEAIFNNRADVAGVFQNSPVGITVCPATGKSWLQFAMSYADHQVVKALIKAGAPINQSDNDGERPIYTAIRREDVNVLRFLLDHGANPNLPCRDTSALHLAILRDDAFEYVALLLQHGANPDALDKTGLRPLHYAARYGDRESVMALMQYGSDPNWRSPQGNATPAEEAFANAHIDIANDMAAWTASCQAKKAIDESISYDGSNNIGLKHLP